MGFAIPGILGTPPAVLRAMARPPQFERPQDLTRDVTAVKLPLSISAPTTGRGSWRGCGSTIETTAPCTRLSLAGVAERVTGKTRHYREGGLQPARKRLEIVPLPPDNDGYHLLYMDENGLEMNVTWHKSIDRAIDQANFEFGLLPSEWERLSAQIISRLAAIA
jgi:hypothetical protein